MVDLSMLGSITGKNDKQRTAKWQQVFKEALENRLPGVKFVPFVRKIMFGCAILLFVKEEIVGHIRQLKTVKVKTGAGGIAANKGSTAIKFNYFDSSFMFLNCHLASGQKEYAERFNNLELCYSETLNAFFNTESYIRPKNYDHQVLMGDMNWRVEMGYQEAVALTKEDKID